MKTLHTLQYSGGRISLAFAALLLVLPGLLPPARAAQLVVEHFAQAVADNSPIGTATGWTAWAVTNGVLQDFSSATPGANYPSMSRANNGGFGSATGNTVLGVNNFSSPALMWTNAAVSLHDCVVTNVVFYTKNNSALSTEQVAILLGGQWYASTQTFHDGGGNSVWASNGFAFTTNASTWQILNTNNLTLGATNSSPLPAGDIQAIGLYGVVLGASGNKIRLDEFIVNGTLPSAPIASTPTASPSASVTAPTTLTLTATANGTLPFAYKWRKDGANLSDGATGSGSTLTGTATNQMVIATTSPADSGNYDVVITNNYGATTSAVLVVTVSAAAVPPYIAGIATSPTNGISEVGGPPMSILVTAGGTGPFTYQWRKAGVNLVNETNDTLTLASVFTNSSSYAVVVASAHGSVTSSPPTTLTVVDTTPPVITFPAGNPTNILINTLFAPVYSVTDNSGATPNLVINGSVNTNASGSYTLQFIASDASNNTNTASLVVNVLLIIEHFNETLVDNAAVSNAPGWHALAVTVANSQVTDYTATGGNANFPTLSENVTAPDALTGGLGFLVMGEVANANPSLVWKDTTTLLQNQQITNLTFYSRNNSASSQIYIAIRIGANWYASTTPFADATGGGVPWTQHAFTFTNDAASWQELNISTLSLGSGLSEPLPNYSISAVGFYGTIAGGKIRLDEVQASGVAAIFQDTPPTVSDISISPTNRVDGSAWTGTPLTFKVSATGTPPLAYFWRKDGVVIPSVTSNIWTLPSPVAADSGSYDVIVTNISGFAVTSSVAVVTVSPGQIFVNQHFNQSTNDPGIIGQVPGWHALALSPTNGVTDYTFVPNPPFNANYPNLALGPGPDGAIGYLVMGQGDTVNPILVWMDTPANLQQGQVSNILFSSRNTYSSSTLQVAVQIAGQWYLSTAFLTDTTGGAVGVWAPQNFLFTTSPGAWQLLDITNLTPGDTTTDPLPAAPITGIGVYGEMYGLPSARLRIDEFLVDGVAAAVASSPTIEPVYRDLSGDLALRAATTAGFNYILESTPALQPPVIWTPVSTNAGTGGVITNLIPVNPALPDQFFRYRVQ